MTRIAFAVLTSAAAGHQCAGRAQGLRRASRPRSKPRSRPQCLFHTLEIVTNDEVHDQNMVVGSCENGTKKIIYQKNDR